MGKATPAIPTNETLEIKDSENLKTLTLLSKDKQCFVRLSTT